MTGHTATRARRSRRAALAAFAATAAMLLAACGGGDARGTEGKAVSKDNPVEIRLGIVNPINSPDYLMVIADKKGFFAKQGIKPKVIEASSTVTPLLSGDFEVTNLGVQGMIPLAKGQPVRFLGMVYDTPTVSLLVPPGSPLLKNAHKWPEVMQDLKGKKLGVTVAGAVLDNMAHYMATLAGMDPNKDLTITAAGNASTLAANLESGTYDAALQVSPLWEKQIARGKAVSVLDMYKGEGPKELATMPFTTPATTETFLSKHPGFDKAFLAALTEAMNWAKDPANRAELTQLVATQSKVDPSTLTAQLNTFVNALHTTKYEQSVWDNGVAMLKSNGINVDKLDYTKDVVPAARG